MNNFFIVGLPRSRTAWLANFMTCDGLFCYHEALNGCHSLAEYHAKLKLNYGDSGTGLMLFDNLTKNNPTVIIERDPKHAIAFLQNGADPKKWVYTLCKRLEAINGLRIPFDKIDDRLEDIWSHLTNKKFNAERAEMLCKFNIQVHSLLDYDMASIEDLFHDKSCNIQNCGR